MTEDRPNPAASHTVLVVEDDYFLAQEMVRGFSAAGITVVGPVSNVDDALDLIGEETVLDGAVLDVNLQGKMSYPVADALQARGVPFVFATGYYVVGIAPAYRQVACYLKPVDTKLVAQKLFG